MSLEHLKKKIKSQIRVGQRLLLPIFFVLCTSLSFAISQILTITKEKEQIKILKQAFPANFLVLDSPEGSEDRKIGASINGTKYYYLNCGGINRIKEANLVYFSSPEQAEARGYSLAAGCKKP